MPCSNAKYGWCGDEEVVHRDGEKEYCVFHAPKDKKGISVEEFNALVFARIDEATAQNRMCNLSGTIFPGAIIFSQYNKYKNKDNPRPAILFHKAKFSGMADFSEAEFSGAANFSMAKFSGAVNFFRAEFSGADFFRAEFSGAADFSMAKFSGAVNFFGAKFSGEADFFGATFSGAAVFRKSEFSGEAAFRGATFKEGDFRGETFLDGARADFENITIEKKVAFNGVRMRKPSFMGTDLDKCEFISCQWDEEDGRNLLHDEDELNKREEEEIGRIEGGRQKFKARHFSPVLIEEKRQVQNLYRKMKQKYKLSHDEFETSKWHASEKEMQRRGTGIKMFFDWLALNLYRLSSGYGENPKQAFKALTAAIIAAVIAMGIMGLSPEGKAGDTIYLLDNTPKRKLDLNNCCKIVLTTVEYLTFQKSTYYGLRPAGKWGTGLKIGFLLLAYIQFTLFVFALRNRFRR